MMFHKCHDRSVSTGCHTTTTAGTPLSGMRGRNLPDGALSGIMCGIQAAGSRRSGLKFTEVEARWPYYHGDINVSLSRRIPISGQSDCIHCQRQRPLHYPYECTGEAAIPRHPCIFCGEKEPKHILEDCPQREKASKKALLVQEIQKRRHQHQRQLLSRRICYACAKEDINNGHLEECSEAGEVADGVGYGPIRQRLDLKVTSKLPGCQYCGMPRPLHYLGDSPSAPYLVN